MVSSRLLLVACFSVLWIDAAGAESSATFRVGSWAGGPAFAGTPRHFEHCSGSANNAQGIAISYSVDRQYRWRLAFSNPTWSFSEGYSMSVLLRLDERGLIRGRATVTPDRMLEIHTEDDLALFAALWSANRLQITMGALRSEFELISSNEVLSALLQCAIRQLKPSRQKSVPSILFNIDPTTREEVQALTNEVLALSGLGDAQKLAYSQQAAVSWKSGLVTSSLNVVDTKGIPRLADLPLYVLERDLRSCRGAGFFAWAIEQADQLEIARIFTVCGGEDATTFAYDAATPRAKGGYYLLRSVTVGSGFAGVLPQQLEAMDARLRAGLILSIRKLERQEPIPDTSAPAADTGSPDAPLLRRE
jgi:hypothetical protein